MGDYGGGDARDMWILAIVIMVFWTGGGVAIIFVPKMLSLPSKSPPAAYAMICGAMLAVLGVVFATIAALSA